MKAPAFAYERPATLAAALGLLAELGPRATPLAGGQSLLATLNLRLSQPEILLDIGRLAELRGIDDRGAAVRVGALTRHVEVMQSDLVARHAPLVALAMPHVAHAAVRNRGTFGGSIALADPAAELPACCVALGATIVLQSAAGERVVPAEAFFLGLYETARRPDELVVAIELPKRPDWRFAFQELSRRHGDFALVGVAAARGSDLRLVAFGCTDRPAISTAAAAAAAAGATADDVAAAFAAGLQPADTIHGRADTKRRLARVLARRALEELA